MTKKISTTKQGFTIIEVVLVLAIAGLIFLMVFVAFPALQRNQRDTQRRQDYADLGAAVINSTTNSNGTFNPGSIEAIEIGNNGQDPDGTGYDINVITTSTQAVNTPSANEVYVIRQGICTGDTGSFNSSQSLNTFVIYGGLSSGTYCREFGLQ